VATPPSFVASYASSPDWTSSTTPKTQTVLADPGDLLLVLGSSDDPGTILGTPSDGANTYTAVQALSTASYSGAYAWAATVAAGGTTSLAVTTTSLPAATTSVAYSATLTASGGIGYTWSIAAGALPTWATLSSGGVISGTPSGSAVTVGFTVRVTDSLARTATAILSITTTAGGTAQPVGPGGTWTLAFEDLFTGTSLNASNWTAVNGASNSGVTTSSSSVSVSGGYCRLVLGGMINSNPVSGFSGPGGGPALAVGDVVEASISFPGSSGNAPYNWPSFWASGASWPSNGEEDIFESYNGTPSALNYHSPSGANNGPFPSGNWCNSFHTYTLVRGSGTNGLKCYWDGNLVRQVTPNDSGGNQSIIVLIGGGNTYSASAVTLVDYVRMWTP
jgi:hypothetical protein